MSESNASIAFAPRAQIVRRAGQLFNTWEHIIPEGTDWPAALTREYWGGCVEKFRDGDEVHCHSFCHRIQFVMRILSVNTATDPIHLDVVFQPIHPAGLALPELPPQRQPRFTIRQAPGMSTFNVL